MKFKALVAMSLLFLVGCEQPTPNPAPIITQSKYRVVQIYGSNEYGDRYSAYHTDDVKYDGVWIKFYDKSRRQWTRMSGNIFVEGGEN
jgi:hypothetical protein